MIPAQRQKYNQKFSPEKYEAFLQKLEEGLIEIPFRVAETPVFVPKALKDKLIEAGNEMISLIRQDNFKSLTENAIPQEWRVPNENAQPHFLTFDFGVCKDEKGELIPMLIEMQGFPSLYGFQHHMRKNFMEVFNIDDSVDYFLNGFNQEKYITLLKKVIHG